MPLVLGAIMCCRVTVSPVVPEEVVRVLTIGKLEPSDGALWKREFPEEGTTLRAQAAEGKLTFSIYPSITNTSSHSNHRLAGAAMFELATRYAEKVNGTIEHISRVLPCSSETGGSTLTVAVYPHQPFTFDSLCLGFRELFVSDR